MDLKECYARYKAAHSCASPRDVAVALGASEARLVAMKCGAEATRLDNRWKALFEGLPALGTVKTMTRNSCVVMERWGAFEHVEMFEAMGQVVGRDIDLRLFPRSFHRAFALTEPARAGAVQRSLQIFDTRGASIHEVLLEDEARAHAFDELVSRHASADQSTDEPAPLPAPAAVEPTFGVDRDLFCAAWDTMKDTHEFFSLLGRFRISRTRALRMAGAPRAVAVETSSLESTLRRAAASELPIVALVGNTGMIHIHTGPVRRVERQDGWVNVLDARMNLRVRAEQVAEAWVVRKPTRDGVVTSLELFDARGETALLMFGARKPGCEEDPRWREVLSGLSERAS